eukprot:6479377-Amphidinium_carterae.1
MDCPGIVELHFVCSLPQVVAFTFSRLFDATKGYPGEGPCSICGGLGHNIQTCADVWGPPIPTHPRPPKVKKLNRPGDGTVAGPVSASGGGPGAPTSSATPQPPLGQTQGQTPLPATPAVGL